MGEPSHIKANTKLTLNPPLINLTRKLKNKSSKINYNSYRKQNTTSKVNCGGSENLVLLERV